MLAYGTSKRVLHGNHRGLQQRDSRVVKSLCGGRFMPARQRRVQSCSTA